MEAGSSSAAMRQCYRLRRLSLTSNVRLGFYAGPSPIYQDLVEFRCGALVPRRVTKWKWAAPGTKLEYPDMTQQVVHFRQDRIGCEWYADEAKAMEVWIVFKVRVSADENKW